QASARHRTSLSFLPSRLRPPPTSPPFPYTTLFRSQPARAQAVERGQPGVGAHAVVDHRALLAVGQFQHPLRHVLAAVVDGRGAADRKSTRLNSSHVKISYAVFCLKKKNKRRISGSP